MVVEKVIIGITDITCVKVMPTCGSTHLHTRQNPHS